MIFCSLIFLFRFLPMVLIAYYAALWVFRKRNITNFVLFAASIIFYAWGEPVYVILLFVSVIINYISGRLIAVCSLKKAKFVIVIAIVINLGILGFYKYADFLIETANSITGKSVGFLQLNLPIGISFYTFQAMSYIIDVYRGNAKAENNIINFGLYLSLFPQLIAGPIVRYVDISKELKDRRENIEDFASGIRLFIIGLSKKVIFANIIGELFNQISSGSTTNLPVVNAWIGIMAFSFQIYFDFSGYSDMARGLGRMFGFHFRVNFNYPYESKSISEFFRRWHISLGTWFKEYVYIPLGGSRQGKTKLIRNIMIVWLLTGIWHGASLNFVLWGLYYGVLILAEKLWLKKYLDKMPVFLSHFYTLLFVMIGWAIFAFDSIRTGMCYIGSMFMMNHNSFIDKDSLYLIVTWAVLFILLILGSTSALERLSQKLKLRGVFETIYLMVIFLLCISCLVNDSYNPFLYFRF
ncbi:MAG: MBOAT family protein [Lachnospiraceae bacterium]|nr:MBOAT family protein [Lachnospiraceae bacterium]